MTNIRTTISEKTLFTKEEMLTDKMARALDTGLFTVTPIIRNMVIGEQAATRNTVVKYPMQEQFGYNLLYRIAPVKDLIDTVSGHITLSFDRSIRGLSFQALPVGADFDNESEPSRVVSFKSPEAAIEAIDSLHPTEEDLVVTPEVLPVLSTNISPNPFVQYMFSFQKVFGRLPRDSEKMELKKISHIVHAMAMDGETHNYPMKVMQKHDFFFDLFHDQPEETEAAKFFRESTQHQETSFYTDYFRMACKFVNFDTVMTKLERVIHEEAMAEVALKGTPQVPTIDGPPFGSFHRQAKTLKQTKAKMFADIAHHVRFCFTQKAESFFLKYYKKERLHTLLDLCLMVEEPDFPQSGNWSVFSNYMLIVASRKQLKDVSARLEQKGFLWENLTVDLPMTNVTHQGTTVRMLEAQDTTAFMLGELTNCCQRLHGAGESCMFEGLVNPFSGFLVIERNSQILAQAWVWQASNGALVFDNIEFANFKGVESINDALYAWLEASPFQNVQVGQGYMEIQFGGKEVKKKDLAWYKQTNWSENPYTDARSRKWLKQDGIITL